MLPGGAVHGFRYMSVACNSLHLRVVFKLLFQPVVVVFGLALAWTQLKKVEQTFVIHEFINLLRIKAKERPVGLAMKAS